MAENQQTRAVKDVSYVTWTRQEYAAWFRGAMKLCYPSTPRRMIDSLAADIERGKSHWNAVREVKKYHSPQAKALRWNLEEKRLRKQLDRAARAGKPRIEENRKLVECDGLRWV